MGGLEDIFTAALWGREPPEVPDWVEWLAPHIEGDDTLRDLSEAGQMLVCGRE